MNQYLPENGDTTALIIPLKIATVPDPPGYTSSSIDIANIISDQKITCKISRRIFLMPKLLLLPIKKCALNKKKQPTPTKPHDPKR